MCSLLAPCCVQDFKIDACIHAGHTFSHSFTYSHATKSYASVHNANSNNTVFMRHVFYCVEVFIVSCIICYQPSRGMLPLPCTCPLFGSPSCSKFPIPPPLYTPIPAGPVLLHSPPLHPLLPDWCATVHLVTCPPWREGQFPHSCCHWWG